MKKKKSVTKKRREQLRVNNQTYRDRNKEEINKRLREKRKIIKMEKLNKIKLENKAQSF